MRVQSCWRNFTRLRARQSFYRLAGASMSVAIANFNIIAARCCTYSTVRRTVLCAVRVYLSYSTVLTVPYIMY
jgi:hypothetical protein